MVSAKILELNFTRNCVRSVLNERHKQPWSFTNWTFQTFPKRLINNRLVLSHYTRTNLEQTVVRLTFFGMCKFTPSSDLDDISSADRKIQSFWRCPVGILRVKSSTKKWLTIKLLAQLLGQNTLDISFPPKLKCKRMWLIVKSSRGKMGHPRN